MAAYEDESRSRPIFLASVSRETRGRLTQFADCLLKWNRTINLISRKDEAAIWDRHILDSLQLAPLMAPIPDRAIDLGSGGGFPGLVLCIATGVPFDLVEADQRKAAFLREAARETGAPARIHATRAERLSLSPAPVVTARALAPLSQLLTLASPFVAPGGYCLFLKGIGAEAELTAAATQWHMRTQRTASQTAHGASILRISEIVPVVSIG